MASKWKDRPWDERFGVAVRTGFARTDQKTGRTIELFLCPVGSPKRGPQQSVGFFAEVHGNKVSCPDCSEKHPIFELFDAIERGYVVPFNSGTSYLEAIQLDASHMVEAIRKSARA